jgi:hypothetical protein
MDLSDSEHGQLTGCCEQDIVPSGSIKGWEILRQLSEYLLFKDSVAYGYACGTACIKTNMVCSFTCK